MAPDGAASPLAETHDAVLVGAGAGSLFAAIALARAGLRPLIVEKSDVVGGGTAYSGGIVWAPDNHRMRAKGMPDSAEDALRYLDAVSLGRGVARLARAYVETVPRVVLEVEEVTTLTWVTYTGLPDYWAELPGGRAAGRFLLPLRWEPRDPAGDVAAVRSLLSLPKHERSWVWGRALVGALYEAALDLGVVVRTGTRAVGLIGSGAGVTGVRVVGPDGVERQLHARRGVLLNTGGFEWNADWTARHLDGPAPRPQTPPANEGDGHAMLVALGLPLVLMDRTIAIPGIRVPGASNDGEQLWRVFFQPLARPHSLVVNRDGRRFANESFFVDLAEAMGATGPGGTAPNDPAWFIWDEQHVQRFGTPGDLDPEQVTEASSLEELATRCGLPAECLAEEVASLNAVVRSGAPDRFDRGATAYQRAFADASDPHPTIGTVDRPPFRAARIDLTTAGHRGGAVIDEYGRVLRDDGSPVVGLYACGNVAAGTVTGHHYFTGTSIGHALVFARRAAQDMLDRT
jgi:succinate dehydrogenase/fumarate reductase flavoprotein subunit